MKGLNEANLGTIIRFGKFNGVTFRDESPLLAAFALTFAAILELAFLTIYVGT